jgi:DNA repair ATPase RecN
VLHKHLNKLEAERANFKKDEIKKLQDEMQELATKKQAHDKNLQYYQQVLGATQNKVAKEQGAMNVMKYDVKKYDKELTHSGGGLKDALYDPIHIDEKGQAKASSIKFATNPYKEKEAGYTDEEYRQEQRMYKTSWYVLMKP